jgi:hypothetical protein
MSRDSIWLDTQGGSIAAHPANNVAGIPDCIQRCDGFLVG